MCVGEGGQHWGMLKECFGHKINGLRQVFTTGSLASAPGSVAN